MLANTNINSLHRNSLWQHYDTTRAVSRKEGKETPRKTWIEVFLGENTLECQGGETFTVRYMITAHLPCLMFVSTRTTGSPGSRVSLTRCTTGEVLADHLIVPLRIVMDLLRLLLTHNLERYTSVYHYTRSDAYVPVMKNRECNPHPDCPSYKLGCSHMVMMNAHGTNIRSQGKENNRGTTATTDDRVSLPQLPVPDGQHMRFRGVRHIRSGIVRHPGGTIFLTTSGWGIVTDRGLKSMMGVQGDHQTQYAFPLCHTEHLPGLVAALDKWLAEDYKRFGLKIATVLPDDVSSVKTPDLDYTTKMDYWTDMWHRVYCIDTTRRAMWRTLYDGASLSVEPVYGAYRKTISKCT